ncbi:MAG: dihydroorotase [Patescibacteria group bacterium]
MTKIISLPALIDPHVHFRVPGGEYKEDWRTGTRAAAAGGVGTVFDMPNNTPSITTLELLLAKKKLIDAQLAEVGSQLKYQLYLGADKNRLPEIARCREWIIGVKMFMGASTGDLLVADEESQRLVSAECARLNLVLAVHAEEEALIEENKKLYHGKSGASIHSKIRNGRAAVEAVKKAIGYARDYGVKIYLLHISTAEEISLIRDAKKEGLQVYAEATPHHLFLDESAYQTLGTRAQMNPPLRSKEDRAALWEAINDGAIDAIGSDHAPHTLAEKDLPYGEAPSGVPGIETTLPLLLNAYNNDKITLEKIIELTSVNIQKIFGLPPNNDKISIDLDLIKIVKNENLNTKCQWSPFAGQTLRGWPNRLHLQKALLV